MVKVNLGSGYLGLEGWLNYDNSVVAAVSKHKWLIRLLVKLHFLPKGYEDIKWPPIIVHDCRKGIPLEDNSVDFIYTSHFLEHLYRHEVVDLLKECRRVLKSGAVIRIVLPDVEKLVQIYLKRDAKAYPLETSVKDPEPTYGDLFVSTFYTSEFDRSRCRGFILRMQEKFLRHHHWMYNADSMRNILEYAGFARIEEKKYRESRIEEARLLDSIPEISFFLEAEKTGA